MKIKHRPILTEQEQALLNGVEVRLIRPQERERFDQIIVEEHYLHNARLVGEQLRYVAEYKGQWVALLSWSAGAYKLKRSEEHTSELQSLRHLVCRLLLEKKKKMIKLNLINALLSTTVISNKETMQSTCMKL